MATPFHDSLGGAALPGRYDPATAESIGALGVLLLHHHNALAERAEALTGRNPAPSVSIAEPLPGATFDAGFPVRLLAVGIDPDVPLYYVMGPLLFLVMLVPFTLNGLAVREAFFVSFLGTLGVGADQAFAPGFLYFLVTLLMALPGAVIMFREGLRGGARPEVEHG